MNIKVTVKNVYGNDLVYPLCRKARSFTRLLGKKTLSPWELKVIQGLGYRILFFDNTCEEGELHGDFIRTEDREELEKLLALELEKLIERDGLIEVFD